MEKEDTKKIDYIIISLAKSYNIIQNTLTDDFFDFFKISKEEAIRKTKDQFLELALTILKNTANISIRSNTNILNINNNSIN